MISVRKVVILIIGTKYDKGNNCKIVETYKKNCKASDRCKNSSNRHKSKIKKLVITIFTMNAATMGIMATNKTSTYRNSSTNRKHNQNRNKKEIRRKTARRNA